MLLLNINKETLTPQNDGITHFNVYSRGRTPIGRFLSHFQYHPMQTNDGYFESMEGYWYWLSVRNDELRNVSGHDAKRLGDHLRTLQRGTPLVIKDFNERVLLATSIKLETMPESLKDKLLSSRLPLVHAYTNGNRYSLQSSMDFVIKHINGWRLKNANF